MDQPRKLFSLEYISLLVIIVLVFCNIAVFYNLYTHLAALGIAGDLKGFLIGIFSLTTIPLYLFAGPFVTHYNAPKLLLLGLLIMGVSGVSYLYAESFWALFFLRMINGAGMFCLSASSLALLVWVIPEEKSGQGFAVFSAAILIPYALVPMFIDAIMPWIPSIAHTYAYMPVALIPAAAVVLLAMRPSRSKGDLAEKPTLPSFSDIRQNISRLPIAVMLFAQGLYYLNFSGLFFLFKDFAEQIKLGNVGHFFGVQMFIMLAVRTFGSGVFDRLNKVWMLSASFLLISGGYLALSFISTPEMITPIAVIFGIGLSLGYPSLNALMFLATDARLRPMNANLMMMALQAGYFLGPMAGGLVVEHLGYQGFFLTWMAVNFGSFVMCALLLRTPEAGQQAAV